MRDAGGTTSRVSFHRYLLFSVRKKVYPRVKSIYCSINFSANVKFVVLVAGDAVDVDAVPAKETVRTIFAGPTAVWIAGSATTTEVTCKDYIRA